MNVYVLVDEEYRGATCLMSAVSSLALAVDELKSLRPFRISPEQFRIEEFDLDNGYTKTYNFTKKGELKK